MKKNKKERELKTKRKTNLEIFFSRIINILFIIIKK